MKYLMNLLALIILAGVVFGVIQLRQTKQYSRIARKGASVKESIGQFFKAKEHNIRLETGGGTRKRPLTFIEQQESLIEMAPNVFADYGDRQWNQFWDYVYNPVRRKEGSYTVKRYRSKEEITEFLIEAYPDPFSYFQADHWD